MFKRKPKPPSISDKFGEKLANSFSYSMSREQVPEPDPIFSEIKWLPRGVTNASISQDVLLAMPQWLRRYWRNIDLYELFKEEFEPEPPKPPKSLTREDKIKMKAIFLGETKEES